MEYTEYMETLKEQIQNTCKIACGRRDPGTHRGTGKRVSGGGHE